jgi:hypothetical protein
MAAAASTLPSDQWWAASSAATTFTIRNTGTAELSGISITKDGSHAGDFSCIHALGEHCPGRQRHVHGGTFSPTSERCTRTAAIHIASNDADENPFDISLSCHG